MRAAQVGVALGVAACVDGESPASEQDSGGQGGTSATAGKGGSSGATAGSGGKSASGGTAGLSGKGGSGTGGNAGAGSGGNAGTGSGGTSNPTTCEGTPLTGGMQTCSSNAQGNIGSYSWTIWSSGTGGCITPRGVDARFKATWNNSGDFLARVGLGFGSNRPWQELGTLSAEFAETKSGTAGGFSYIGIYGWSVNPLREYYIVDDWFNYRPNPGPDSTIEGNFTLDDGEYDIYKHTQVNAPAITGGNQTFDQFFSIRKTARQCGRISITEHFKQWEAVGLTLGNMVEARILVEAGGGAGELEFTTATLTVQ